MKDRMVCTVGTALAVASVVSVVTFSARPALAWNHVEHAAFGTWSMRTACAMNGDPVACGDPAMFTLAGAALEAPDACHSFWFSAAGILANDDDKADRTGCAIRGGVPLTQSNALVHAVQTEALVTSIYQLLTNSNHFGENTKAHFQLFHALALQAAALRPTLASVYTTPPDSSLATPNPMLAVCTRAAVGLESYGLHYLTDRTAAGHAWNPEPRYQEAQQVSTSGLRACFHGQDRAVRIALELTGFSCLDDPDFSVLASNEPHVFAGLGDAPRSFGDMWAGQGAWTSDLDYTDGGTAQHSETQDPAEQAYEELFATLRGTGGTAGASPTDPAWVDTFVANQDFCRVTLAECCRSSTSSTLGTCDYCAPDITDAEVHASCPVDSMQGSLGAGTDDGKWVAVASKYLGVNYAHYSGTAPTGTDVARSIAISSSSSTVHPDAQWDAQNQVVTRLGCQDFEITAANLSAGSGLVVGNTGSTLTFVGNPKRPLTAHFRPDASCSDPSICGPQDVAAGSGQLVSTASPDPLSPLPVSVALSCNGPGKTASGSVYLTDASGSWTNAFPTSMTCK